MLEETAVACRPRRIGMWRRVSLLRVLVGVSKKSTLT